LQSNQNARTTHKKYSVILGQNDGSYIKNYGINNLYVIYAGCGKQTVQNSQLWTM